MVLIFLNVQKANENWGWVIPPPVELLKATKQLAGIHDVKSEQRSLAGYIS